VVQALDSCRDIPTGQDSRSGLDGGVMLHFQTDL